MATPAVESRYRIVDFAPLTAVTCPCGTARRAFADVPDFPGTVHQTRITTDVRVHYHRRLTEVYYILECSPEAQMELDGHVLYTVTLRPDRDMQARDIRLELPFRKDIATYLMGINHDGGLRKPNWEWKWGGQIYYDSFWIGDYDAGMQLELRGASYCGPMVNLYWNLGQLKPPTTWDNGGKGGVTVKEQGDVVTASAYCGERLLKAGEDLTLAETYDGGRYRFDGDVVLDRSGAFGYTVRVLPRNALLTSVAPTGTISLFAGNVSSGIEPVFAYAYTRKVLQKDGSRTEEEVVDYAVALWRAKFGDKPLPDYFVNAQTLAPDAHVRAAALEILSDVALYDGQLSEVARITDQLRRLGVELGDRHAVVIAVVNASLALAFDNQAVGALALLATVDGEGLSPSDHAWVMYAQGEALSAAGDPAATTAYAHAVAMAMAIGNPFVTSVARVSLATEQARAGDFREALRTYAVCLHEYARHGNFVHAVTTVRNLIEVLVAVGDDHGAAVLAAATSGDGVRPSYGVETARLSRAVAGVAQRAGPKRFAAWSREGRLLDVRSAVQLAADLVDRHRG